MLAKFYKIVILGSINLAKGKLVNKSLKSLNNEFFLIGFLKTSFRPILMVCVAVFLVYSCGKPRIDSFALDLNAYKSYLTGENFFDTSTYLNPETGAPTSAPQNFVVSIYAGALDTAGNIPGAQHEGQTYNAHEARFITINGLGVYGDFLFLSDKLNNVIKRFNLATDKAQWFLGNGRVETDLFEGFDESDIEEGVAMVRSNQIITGDPGDLAITKDYLYFVGSTGRIARFNLDGSDTLISNIPVIGVDGNDEESVPQNGIVEADNIRIPYPKGIVFSKTTRDFYTTFGNANGAGKLRRITLPVAGDTQRYLVNFVKKSPISEGYESFSNAKALAAIGSSLYLSDDLNVIYKLDGGDQVTAENLPPKNAALRYAGNVNSGGDVDGNLTNASFGNISNMTNAGNFLYILISDNQIGSKRSIRILNVETGDVTTPNLKNPDGSNFTFPNGARPFLSSKGRHLSSIVHHKNGQFYVGSSLVLYKLVVQ